LGVSTMANERILIVEDDDGVAYLVQVHLQRCGYQIAGRVASGEEALAQAEQSQARLALMDINLAGQLDGVQTAIRLRQQFDLPVVFITGLADDETLQRSREAKAFGYVVKPFRQEDLKSSIDLALNKHQVESRLRRIERSFTAAVRSIGEGVIMTDEQSRVIFLNPVAETLTGWSRESAPGDRALHDIFRLSPLEGRAPGELTPASPRSEQAELKARDGSTLPIEFTTAPIRNDAGTITGQVLIFRDITDRRRAEAELTQSRENLRSLAAHMETLRENERTRIAREVHDELGQMITGLRMDLAWIQKRLAAISDEPLREPLLGKARSMSTLLEQLVKAVRKIASELRPAVLDLGLCAAMDWQARDWQQRTGIMCELVTPSAAVLLPEGLGTALFRIFQETLTNAARHAQATRVQVRLSLADGWVTLEIRDNGLGITAEQQRQTKSFGLLGMKERANILGGSCTVRGVPGQGTTVEVKLPLPAA
ncbi:MAG TPA: response regulator, partial [Candidatus Dormibacteraeota bacterium]|nr:response regulator [Candidatus Dormibacteraeota bacterium]